jgi:AdoMet-dependent rRNA methyltransferase SPB1
MDIGLEQVDATLVNGQADLFNLDATTVVSQSRNGVLSTKAIGDLETLDSSFEVETVDNFTGYQSDMDAQLDAMYTDFKTRRAAKDAKFRMQESRKRNKLREEGWRGISGGHFEGSCSDEDTDEGGWEAMETMKVEGAEDENDSDTTSDSNPYDSPASTRQPAQSRAITAVNQWFSQDIFADIHEEDLSLPKDSFYEPRVRHLLTLQQLLTNFFRRNQSTVMPVTVLKGLLMKMCYGMRTVGMSIK